MIGRRILLAAAVTLAVAAPAGAQSSPTGEIRRQLTEYVAGWRSMDVDRVSALYASDADILFFDGAPLKYTGWAEYEKGAKAGFAGLKSIAIGPSADMSIHRNGKVAWSTGTMSMTIVPKQGAATRLDVRSTIVWEKRESRWLIVHEHLSAPFQGPPKA